MNNTQQAGYAKYLPVFASAVISPPCTGGVGDEAVKDEVAPCTGRVSWDRISLVSTGGSEDDSEAELLVTPAGAASGAGET